MNWPDLTWVVVVVGGLGSPQPEPTESSTDSSSGAPAKWTSSSILLNTISCIFSAKLCSHGAAITEFVSPSRHTRRIRFCFYCDFLCCRVHSIKLDSWSQITCVTPCNLIRSVLQPRPCISGVWSPPRATSFPSQTTSSPSKMMERSTASRWAGNRSRKWLRALSCCGSIFPSSRPFWDNYFPSCALAWLQLLFRRKKELGIFSPLFIASCKNNI